MLFLTNHEVAEYDRAGKLWMWTIRNLMQLKGRHVWMLKRSGYIN